MMLQNNAISTSEITLAVGTYYSLHLTNQACSMHADAALNLDTAKPRQSDSTTTTTAMFSNNIRQDKYL